MNRDYLIKKGKEIKENGNMLGIKVTILILIIKSIITVKHTMKI